MGMLEGKVIGDVMAIKIAEIGAQGAERMFTIVSKDKTGEIAICSGSYGYRLEDGTVFDGDVRNADLEKALPIIKETGVARAFSMVRGHFKSKDGQWLHIDTGMGNHFFLRDIIGKEFLKRFAGRDTYSIYLQGVKVVQGILKEMK